MHEHDLVELTNAGAESGCTVEALGENPSGSPARLRRSQASPPPLDERRFGGPVVRPSGRLAALLAAVGTTGSHPAMRAPASAGALHPIETYVIVHHPRWGAPPGLYHYLPSSGALELRRAAIDGAQSGACDRALQLAFSIVYARSSWKYGERAFRLAHLDLGHYLASVAAAASAGGLRTSLRVIRDPDARRALALPDDESPGPLVEVVDERSAATTSESMAERGLRIHGAPIGARPPRLRERWPAVLEAHTATDACEPWSAPLVVSGELAGVLGSRRSARTFSSSPLSIARLAEALRDPAIRWPGVEGHLALHAHHVEGLAGGIYRWVGDTADQRIAHDVRRLSSVLGFGRAALATSHAAILIASSARGPAGVRRALWWAGATSQVVQLRAATLGLGGCAIGGLHDAAVRRLHRRWLDGASPRLFVALGERDGECAKSTGTSCALRNRESET
jgi:SagB-type dehydrogenase family enzyme